MNDVDHVAIILIGIGVVVAICICVFCESDRTDEEERLYKSAGRY